MNSYKGLNSRQVEESRIKYGSNVLTPPKRVHWLLLFLGKFKDPLIIILSIAAAISLTITIVFGKGSLMEIAGIIIAIILATLVSFLNERKAGKEFDILNKVSDDDKVKVIRQKENGESRVMTIPQSEVVTGDYVILSEGDEIPADGTVLEAVNLKVDESSLNGESKPSSKRAEKTTGYNTAYSPNNLYRGTIVSEGEGVMLVETVGDKTEIGKTARAASEHTGVQTPLSRQLAKLGKQIGWVGISISVLVFLALFVYELHHNDLDFSSPDGINRVITMFMLAVTLIVMAVPEGLPMSISLSLAYSMRKMTAQNALVRKMHACETMGAATVICTDKTGTLTQNKMKVAECTLPLSEETARAISLNSTAFLDDDKYIGNPTEGAMLKFISDNGFDYRAIRAEREILARIPFSSSLKYMASAVSEGNGKQRVLVKGSPEVVLSFSGLQENEKAAELEKISSFQKRGMRCISFAHKSMNMDRALESELKNLEYDGFIAIEDPVRVDVPKAIAKCESAGIAIKIVTGDNSLTAIEIARQATLWKDTDTVEKNSITGQEFASLDDEQAKKRIPDIKVMSRARPEDKVRLVKLLESMGEVVAVTGDGTNDAPALNYANVGLSMGSGTAVAKESSDIIILDDSFSTVVNAVEWGRSIYHNIQRFIFFQLSVNVAALLTAIAGPLFLKEEYPLTITQILWINLIMDTLAALALASEPKDPAVMEEKPRKPGEPIVNRYIWNRILLCGLGMFAAAFIFMLVDKHAPNAEGYDVFLSVFFTGFVLMQWWNLLNARTLMTSHGPFHKLGANKNFLLVFAIILILQIMIVEVFPGELFRTTHLTAVWWTWPALLAVTSMVLAIGQGLRLIHMKKQQ